MPLLNRNGDVYDPGKCNNKSLLMRQYPGRSSSVARQSQGIKQSRNRVTTRESSTDALAGFEFQRKFWFWFSFSPDECIGDYC